jgi:methionyl-tRNA formyltransferase
MRIVFFGTPEYTVPIAEGLYKEFHTFRDKGVVAVVTQPPKPSGRKKQLAYSAIDRWAHKREIEIIYNYEDLPEADLGVVAAYGRIIPQSVIEHFSNGILNVHPSLLPKYRGASPIQAALAAGETETGVTIIKMDEKMDHGPIVSSFVEEIKQTDTNEVLRKRLFDRSVDFLIELIPSYIDGKIKLKEQDHNKATFTKLVKREDGYIEKPFENPVKTYNLYRAYSPWPGIYTNVNIKGEENRLKINKLHLHKKELVLDEVQLEGKNPVSFEEFKRGYPNLSL